MKQQIPLKLVGGCHYGKYNRMSTEQTINLMISDNGLVPYAGYRRIHTISDEIEGRKCFVTTASNDFIFVSGSQLYYMNESISAPAAVVNGLLNTSIGAVFMAEDNLGNVVITDYNNVYVYDAYNQTMKASPLFSPAEIAGHYSFGLFSPGMIMFQNGRFVVCAAGTNKYVMTEVGSDPAAAGLASWPAGVNEAYFVGQISTKPDFIQGILPFPGKGNLMIAIGYNVTEFYTDVGTLFPYQRSSSFNLDYGAVNAECIAYQENFVCWIGFNKNSNPVLLYSDGGDIKRISNDGLDYQMAQLKNPKDCFGFLLRLDGHLIYQFVFREDNKSFFYDFNTQEFFISTDEGRNYYPIRNAAYYQNNYYALSINDGNVYEMGTQYYTYDYGDGREKEIPRIRILPAIALPSQDWFTINWVSFPMDTGLPNPGGNSLAVDYSVSRDGGRSFGVFGRQNLPLEGHYQYKFIEYNLGIANDATLQFRFLGNQRVIIFDGVAEVCT